MPDADRAGQGSSDFRAFLRGLPDDIAKAAEDGLPVVLDRTSPLKAHAQRLMDTLGVEVRIVTQTELTDPARREQPTSTGYEASAERALVRAAADDEALEICAECMCEIDVDEPAHRPGCPGVGKPRVSRAAVLPGLVHKDSFDEGAVDLDQEEGPRSPTPGSGGSDEEPPAMRAPTPEATDAAGEPELEPGPAPDRDQQRSYVKWTPEKAIDRVREVAAELGRPPKQRETGQHALPSPKTARELFGSWAAMIEQAGFPRPTRGRTAGSPAHSVHIVEGFEPPAHAETELPELAEPAAEPEPAEPTHAESMRDAPPVDDLTLGLTFEQLTAAGHALEAVASQLQHLEREDRAAVWAFVQPLIEAALA